MNPQQIARIVQNEINKGLNNVQNKTFYRGIVDAATGNKANVILEGADYPVMNIICLEGYLPTAGDQVIVVSIGNSGANYFVLGKTDLDYTPVTPSSELTYDITVRGNQAFSANPATFTAIPYAAIIDNPDNIVYTFNEGFKITEAGYYDISAGLRLADSTQGNYRMIYEIQVLDENANFLMNYTKRIYDDISGGTSRGGGQPGVALGSAQFLLPKNCYVIPKIWHNIESTWNITERSSLEGDTYFTLHRNKARDSSTINLISNGGFFATIASLWSAPAGNTLTYDTAVKHIGVGSLRIANSGTTKTAQYGVAIKPGRSYRFKCWVRSSVANASFNPNYVNLNNLTATALPTMAMPTAGTWYEYDRTFTASADRTHIQPVIQMTGGFANLDDVEFYEL